MIQIPNYVAKLFSSEDSYDILEDIQRVESTCDLLSSLVVVVLAIRLDLDIKLNWTRLDIPTIEEMERIRGNVEAIAKCCDSSYSISEFGNRFNYKNANDLENALKFAFDYLRRIIEVRYCPIAGYYTANEPNYLIAERRV